MEENQRIDKQLSGLERFRRLHDCNSHRILSQILDEVERGFQERKIPRGETALAGIRSWITDGSQDCNRSPE